MRKANIYFNLIRNEDSYTEAFINLMIFDDVRKGFCDYLKNMLKEKIEFEYENINSQVRDIEKARPDIVIETSTLFIIIENKINVYTEMTKEQLECYESYFKRKTKKKKKKFLIFMIPKMYKHASDIEKTLRKARQKDIILHANKLYWEDVISNIKHASSQYCYQDFIEITKDIFWYENISILEDEMKDLSNESVRIVIKLNKIVENLKRLYNNDKNYKVEDDLTEYNNGLHLIDRDTNEHLLYFGIVYDLWEKTNEPFYIGFSRNSRKSVIKKIKNCEGVIELDNDDFSYIKVPITDIANIDDSATGIHTIIKELIN